MTLTQSTDPRGSQSILHPGPTETHCTLEHLVTCIGFTKPSLAPWRLGDINFWNTARLSHLDVVVCLRTFYWIVPLVVEKWCHRLHHRNIDNIDVNVHTDTWLLKYWHAWCVCMLLLDCGWHACRLVHACRNIVMLIWIPVIGCRKINISSVCL
jgi:hypothetical protein